MQQNGALSQIPPLRWPTLIVFVSSTCMMILELVAGRIIAPYVGVSLYTWTSVIGVVLAGMSLGNYLGGQLADRWASRRLLGGIFLAGSVTSLGIFAADVIGLRMPDTWPIVARILLLTAALFLIPSVLLGTISPVVTKLAVLDLSRTGSTVGRISAAATAGSILGTFATGFILIAWLGTRTIIWSVAIVLLLMAMSLLLMGLHRSRAALAAVVLVVIAGMSVLAVNNDWLKSSCSLETNYFCIKVREEERDGKPVRVLILDRLVHSYSSLDDPTQLVYGYERVYAEVTQYQAQRHTVLETLFIGGGGYTFPRYMEALYPQSELDVIEIDPGVTQVAHQLLGLARESEIASYNEDARMFLDRTPSKQYDLVMGDAFNDYSVPYHLTTREFNERVQAWLAHDGLYLANMIDGPRRDFLRAYVATLRETFANVYVAPAIATWRTSSRVTFVIVASDTPLDLRAFDNIDAFDGDTLFSDQVLDQDDVEGILAEGRVVLLTDHFAPVDQMLAPVVRGEEARPDGPQHPSAPLQPQ